MDDLHRYRRDPVVAFGELVGAHLRPHPKTSPKTAALEHGVSLSLIRWRDKKAEGHCRMCKRDRATRPLTEHHIVPVSWFAGTRRRFALRLLRNVAANKVPLCRGCHDLVEHDVTARRQLRRVLAPDETTFVIQTAGRAWLDDRYPPRGTQTP